MKRTKKNRIALGLALLLTAGLCAGCSSSSSDSSQTSESNDDTYKIGICQLVQHAALDDATDGFKQALIDTLGEENVSFDYQNASNDSATCSTITNNFVADDVDLIMANATASLQAAMQSTTEIPIVATSVTDFATALEMTDWTGTTGINVTGVSDLAPLAEQAAMIQELFPETKEVGIVYCSAEANSVYQAEVIAEELEKLGIASTEYTAADSNDISAVVQNACDNSDVLYIPTDNTMASSTGIIEPIASAANIPVITGEENTCKGCGLATLSVNYYSLGYKAGEMAADILQNGADPATMEVSYATDLTKEYVAERATAVGVTMPDTYVEIDMSDE